MTPPVSAYQSLITPRSRRLRTVGLVLLAAILCMVAYGARVLMPNVRHEVEVQRARNLLPAPPVSAAGVSAGDTARARTGATLETQRQERAQARARKVAFAKVAVAYAYWGVCMLLLLAVLFVAWLDWREVARVSLSQQFALRAEAIQTMSRPAPDDSGAGIPMTAGGENAPRRADAPWMRRALRLAAQGFTPPNPMVGCVIVKNGESVGEGFHPYAGALHAERFALANAGEKARGATAYVTLEPHGHWSRTPPCTDALIAAGVARVVAATLDSNPKVSGRGIAQLQQAGITVDVGVCESQARRLNEAFFHFHETGTPFVVLKAAMTLDGKIATRTGDSKWITGEKARAWVHEQRARAGAVMVGIETLLADDAQLTARLPNVDLPRQPLRIVVDSRLRTPGNSQAVALAHSRPEFQPLLIATTERGGSGARNRSLSSRRGDFAPARHSRRPR